MKTLNDNTLTQMLSRIKREGDKLQTSVDGNNHLMAVFARNIGDMEGQVADNNTAITQAQTDLAAQVVQAEADLENHVDAYMDNLTGDAADTIEDVNRAVAQFDGRRQQMDQAIALVADLYQTMEEADLNRLNRPNLLKQNYYERYDEPLTEMVGFEYTIPAETAAEIGTPITYTGTHASITANATVYSVEADDIFDWDNVTCVCTAGSAQITIPARTKAHDASTVIVYVCEHAMRTIIYGQTSKRQGHDRPYLQNIRKGMPSTRDVDPDEVSVQLVELTGNDIITEPDEEVYNTALAFTVSEAGTDKNVEQLIYKYGSFGAGTFTDTAPKEYGNITEMEVGQTYTMSCWARITNGERAQIKMAYDPIKRSSSADCCEWFEVSSPTWKRIYWTFTFDQTGNQFTDTATTKEVDGATVAATKREFNWTKTISFGVSRKYAGTVQLCGFRLTAGGLHMNSLFDQHNNAIEDLKERVSALEAMMLENMGN